MTWGVNTFLGFQNESVGMENTTSTSDGGVVDEVQQGHPIGKRNLDTTCKLRSVLPPKTCNVHQENHM